jgi:hypothetical protein
MCAKTKSTSSTLAASVADAADQQKPQAIRDGSMFFLLRVAFWLTVVLALLPTGSTQPSAKGSHVGAADAVVAASAAVSDMGNFCDRQAQACEVGTQTAVAIGHRAQAGAKMVYEFISEHIVRGETGSVPESKSPSVKNAAGRAPPLSAPATVPQHKGSQSTLKPADLGPAWHNPPSRQEAQPRKDGKVARSG